MSKTALVLAAHGSHHVASVNESIRALATVWASESPFDEVLVAFHQGEPAFSRVLDATTATQIVVVPVMTSEGYYCDDVLPRELGRNRRVSDKSLRFVVTRPVGTHPRLADVVGRRIQSIIETRRWISENVSVVLIGHGTKRNTRSRLTTETLAAVIRAAGVCGETLFAYLDDEPLVESIGAAITRPHVLVMPFLIGGGPHAVEDIPRRLGINESVFVDAPIGALPELRSLIGELAIEALHEMQEKPVVQGAPAMTNIRPLRLGTRRSALAMWQARHVAALLSARRAQVELVEIATSGDRNLQCAIADLYSDAPFTDDIDDALRSGKIDFAVHALKDLPVPPPDDLELVAVLPRGDVSESLVSYHKCPLAELPFGARVGTSSPRRAAQLLRLRPDLIPTTIRGAVDDRVRQVRRGDFDAAILATAGLQRLGMMQEIAETFSLEDLLPAPGQGALVVQISRCDNRLQQLLAPLDHEPTRRAVTAELGLLRRLQQCPGLTLAAWARPILAGAVMIHARLMSLDGTRCTDVRSRGGSPDELMLQTAEQLRSQIASLDLQSTIDIKQSTILE